MKKTISILLVIAIILCAFSGCSNKNNQNTAATTEAASSAETDADIEIDTSDPCVTVYNNGNSVYHPENENAHFDSDSKELYYDNLLYVFLAPGVSKDEIVSLADSVDGYVCSKISTCLSFVQIKVDSTDLNELKKKAEELNKSENVIQAGYEFPNAICPTVTDPWSDDPQNPDKGINSDMPPKGNDWWAEAIDAYKAWEYSDVITDFCNVGIVDNGFNPDHEDLSGNLKIVEGLSNSPQHHGTHVAGLVVAQNNGVGIRGVADKSTAYCIDFEEVSVVNIGDYVNYYSSLIALNIRVINFSLCSCSYLSKSGYMEKKYKKEVEEGWGFILQFFIDEEYESYKEYMEVVHPRQTGMAAIATIASLIAYDNDDFIIVQSAGNGIDNGGKGINAYINGDFCSITEDTFNNCYSQNSTFYDEYKIDYNDVSDHKIIVGAVTSVIDNSGNYIACSFSNFGETVDIYSPGETIFSTYYDEEYSDEANRSLYDFSDGTSMAAPIVTGSVALLWSAAPNLSAGQVKECLINNVETFAVGVGDDKGNLHPMLNIGKAIESQGLTVTLNKPEEPSLGSDLSASEVGDIIEFGQYEQDNDTANGTEAIEWRVLATENGRALIISSKALQRVPYNDEDADTTWETSSIREWLNDSFYNTAFSSSEQAKICSSTLENESGSTVDKVFLLSTDEANTYFTSDEDRVCYATVYAKAHGADEKASSADPRDSCFWWLRSPGYYAYCATTVTPGGNYSVNNNVYYGGSGIRTAGVCIRPAIWIDF